MGTTRTSQDHVVSHNCHINDADCGTIPLTAAEIAHMKQILSTDHPYVIQVGLETKEYNCHGFTLASSHGWYFDPNLFIEDDHDEVSFDDPQVGDVVVYYRDDLDVPAHSALVQRVTNNKITLVRSKWGGWVLLDHGLRDVRPSFGRPRRLIRRKSGVGPLVVLTEALTMTEQAAGGEMPKTDEESRQEIIDQALKSFSDPRVYLEVVFASTPEVAKKIIEDMPGMQELLALGPEEAGRVALEFLNRSDTRASEEKSSIALYILQRATNEEAVHHLADDIRERKFTGLNVQLSAEALLANAGVEAADANPVMVAKDLAEKLKP